MQFLYSCLLGLGLVMGGAVMADHHDKKAGKDHHDCKTHAGHDHKHGKDCGHKAVKHGDHTDYQDGDHKHFVHGDHVDDHQG